VPPAASVRGEATTTAAAEAPLISVARRVASWARPGEDVEVYVARSVATEVRAYEGEVESLVQAAGEGVGVRVLVGSRQGFAHAAALDERTLATVLEEARDNARFATPDEHVRLARPDGVAPVALDLIDERLAAVPVDRKVALALELERRTRADPRVRAVPSADYDDAIGEWAVVTTTGIEAGGRRSVASLSVLAIAGDGADSHTGFGISAGRGFEQLDPVVAADDAADRAARLVGARVPRAQTTTVVFDPRVTATLLAVVASALSGEAVVKGRSMFAGRLGEQVAAGSVTLVEDPTDGRAFGASCFDAEGLACRRVPLVERGTLVGFAHDTVSASRMGVSSTASAVRGGHATTPVAGCRAVRLEPGEGRFEDVVAGVGEGVYVQSVTGVHSGVNPVSGDFSVGIEGLRITGGALGEPLREATVASTLQRMLASVVALGGDLVYLPGVAAGVTLAIEGMALAGRGSS
jgi:PmbA protein